MRTYKILTTEDGHWKWETITTDIKTMTHSIASKLVGRTAHDYFIV